MHIPDGFLDAKTVIVTAGLSVAGVAVAVRHIRRACPHSHVPLIGLAAAFIFAAQMLNFPVAGGTSGHLIGGVLAAILLGPHAAILVMASVLILQSLLFADGGITTLGANIFNMGILAPVIGYSIYRLVYGLIGASLRARLLATAFAAWCSTVAASIACAGQLALSGTANWTIVFPAMANIHMIIGLGEAFITTLVIAALAKSRPELLSEDIRVARRQGVRQFIVYGLLVSAGLALFIAPAASSWPDGLERVAATLGFEHKVAADPLISSPLPDYTIPGLHSAVLSTVVAGVVGLFLVFGLAYLLARKLTTAKTRES
jgi:cobalt/nickel transport system permease protein